MTYILVCLHKAAVEGSVPVGPLEQRHHRFAVQLPPHEQVVRVQMALVRGHGVTFDLSPLRIVGVAPWLRLAKEVHHFGFMAVPVKIQHQKRTWDGRMEKREGFKAESLLYSELVKKS